MGLMRRENPIKLTLNHSNLRLKNPNFFSEREREREEGERLTGSKSWEIWIVELLERGCV